MCIDPEKRFLHGISNCPAKNQRNGPKKIPLTKDEWGLLAAVANEWQDSWRLYSCTGAISQVQDEYLEQVRPYSRRSTCEQARMSTYTSCCLLCHHGNHVYSTPPEAHQLATGLQYRYGVLMDLPIQWLQRWPWQIMLA